MACGRMASDDAAPAHVWNL